MKIAYLVIVYATSAWALPKEIVRPQYNRLYIGPGIPIHDSSLTPRIINGHEAIPHSIPYQAYIIITGELGTWCCGGVLLSTKYVLTAGHCVNGGDSAVVYLGAHDIDYKESTQIRVNSSRLILHEEYYEYTFTNDIGLVELSEPVELNDYVGTAELPLKKDANNTFEGENARVSGWGLIAGTGSRSSVLLEANATVISNALCHAIYEIAQDDQICTGGEDGVASCRGDSGGPLIDDNKLIGIVSFSVTNCVEGFPTAYTRVSSFLEWIEAHSDVLLS